MQDDAEGVNPELGRLIEAYIKDESLFAALEAHLTQVSRAQPELQALWDLIYHGINHFDVDAGIRANDAHYADLAEQRLRGVAIALISGPVGNVELAARRCLGARLPDAAASR